MEELQKRFEKEQLVDWLEAEVRKGVVGKEVFCYINVVNHLRVYTEGRACSRCLPIAHEHK